MTHISPIIDQFQYYHQYLRFLKRLYIQLYDYFTDNDLFSHSQYGFRSNHSTELAVLEVIDRIILDMDKGKLPVNIYLDLSKAFDTLDFNILLEMRINFSKITSKIANNL